jgi:hypothetical protein
MRWEAGRALPVHRVSGGEKDAVFARRSELDAWTSSVAGVPEEPEQNGNSIASNVSLPPIGACETQALRAWRPCARTAAIAVFAVGVVTLAFFALRAVGMSAPEPAVRLRPSQAGSGSASTPRVVPPRSINLKLFLPDGGTGTIGIADGGAGHIGGTEKRPTVVLRPRRDGQRLLLEIGRADGRPVTGNPAPSPLTVILEPGVVVDVRDPFHFKVEWLR